MAPRTRAAQLADRGESLETVAKRIEVPEHIAIVMDGNGRWAKERGLPRTAGHEAGEKVLFDLVEAAIGFGVKEISAYAFQQRIGSAHQKKLNS